MNRRLVLQALSATAVGALPLIAKSQSAYPARAVRIVVPWAPGGTVDFSARVLADQYTKLLSQSFVVENRPGGAGVIGFAAVASAPADGYTLLIDNTALMGTLPVTNRKLPFDPERDLQVIAQAVEVPVVLVVPASTPYRTLKDLVDAAKASPGKYNYGSGGAASTTHLQAAMFNDVAGIDLVHVPYKGGGDAVRALISNEVQMLITGAPTAVPQIQTGRVRALAVSGRQRLDALPDVPTFAEAGVPGYTIANRYSLIGSSALPAEIVARLVKATETVIGMADVQQKLAQQGAVPAESSAAGASKDIAQWRDIARRMGVPE